MLRFEQDGAVAIVTLDRPEARNAIDGPMAQAIEDAITRIEGDDSVMVGIVTHRATCSARAPTSRPCAAAKVTPSARHEAASPASKKRVRAKPLIAAVDGKALGGGSDRAAACDLIVASTTLADFAAARGEPQPAPTAGGVTRLTWAIPPHVALELILTAAPFDARAADLGLVSSVVAPGEALRKHAVSRMRLRPTRRWPCRGPPSRARSHHPQQRGADTALSDQEWLVIHASEDFHEGPHAFAEKRVLVAGSLTRLRQATTRAHEAATTPDAYGRACRSGVARRVDEHDMARCLVAAVRSLTNSMSSVSNGDSPGLRSTSTHTTCPKSLVGNRQAHVHDRRVLFQHLFHLFRVDLLSTAVDARSARVRAGRSRHRRAGGRSRRARSTACHRCRGTRRALLGIAVVALGRRSPSRDPTHDTGRAATGRRGRRG